MASMDGVLREAAAQQQGAERRLAFTGLPGAQPHGFFVLLLRRVSPRVRSREGPAIFCELQLHSNAEIARRELRALHNGRP